MQLRQLAAAALIAATMVGGAASADAQRPTRTAIIAFVGEDGMNVLHHDFDTADGRNPDYPSDIPPVTSVSLPRVGNFAQREAKVAAGPLGHLQPGVVYAVTGTRLLVVAAPSLQPETDVTASGTTVIGAGPSSPTLHGTGVVDAAIGRRYGTAPTAIGVLVLGPPADAWNWVARQAWIDLASTSSYDAVPGCDGVSAVRSFTSSGRLVFSSSGNTTDPAEQVTAPNGLREVYQVGGVDPDGRPYLPPHEDSDPWFAAGTVTRPYQTGELYSFITAADDSDSGSMRFGGTSGATPRTAGWAADLLMWSWQHPGRRSRGPMRDGQLSGAELATLMHDVARPYFANRPGDYLLEGYGALNRAAIGVATQVLAGAQAEPSRADDDAAAALVSQVREAAFAQCSAGL